jgi:hypothetical protein
MQPYVFQRGETVSLALEAVSGDPLMVSAVTAAMKPLAPGRATPDPEAAVAATFSVTFVAAGGGDPARWLLTLSAVESAALAAGSYAADARLVIGGGVAITDMVRLRLEDAVTTV